MPIFFVNLEAIIIGLIFYLVNRLEIIIIWPAPEDKLFYKTWPVRVLLMAPNSTTGPAQKPYRFIHGPRASSNHYSLKSSYKCTIISDK